MELLKIDFSSPLAAHKLDRDIAKLQAAGTDCFKIGFTGKIDVRPNKCVPIAAIADWYRGRGGNFEFDFPPSADGLRQARLDHPLDAEAASPRELLYPLGKVWRYSTPEGIAAIVTAAVRAIRESVYVEKGIISSVEWCLNEVMDNVLQHSSSQFGYVMGQATQEDNKVSICVFDFGIGIYESLKKSKHAPNTPQEALNLAIQEKVTRDENIGQGNGLWGLRRIIKENGGSLFFESNAATANIYDGVIENAVCDSYCAGEFHNATIVDFQLDLEKSVNIAALFAGYAEPVDLWLEDHEAEDYLYFSLKDDAAGTGTRLAAKKLRNAILNSLKEGYKKIVIDFDGIGVISSSFADELIGKIIAEKGFTYFSHCFALKNVSPLNRSIIDRSVEQRMAQKYYDAPPPKDDGL